MSCHGFQIFENSGNTGERLANLPHPDASGNHHGESITIDLANA
jgi:hypothetical protein